jgi:hypothetical protein
MFSNAPYGMSANAFQCLLTRKEFPFSDRESKKKAFEELQAHAAAEIRRREQIAGKQLSFRELIRWSGPKAEEPAKEPVPQEAAAPKPTPEPHPLVKHIYRDLQTSVVG